jgi:hypothetical protein
VDHTAIHPRSAAGIKTGIIYNPAWLTSIKVDIHSAPRKVTDMRFNKSDVHVMPTIFILCSLFLSVFICIYI